MSRDREAEHALLGMGWTVLRFWGKDIHKCLNGCVDDIKDAIFQSMLEKYDKYIEEFDFDGDF